MKKAVAWTAFAMMIALGDARAQDDPFLEEWMRYFRRIDTITVEAGDARDANAVTHIITPWPYYARNRRIPANGERMVGAVDRYKNPRRLGVVAPTLAPIISGTVGTTGGGGAGGAGGVGFSSGGDGGY